MKVLGLTLGAILLAAVVAGCGGEDEQASESPSLGVGPGISMGDAFESDLAGPLLINGFLLIQGGEHDHPERVMFCEVLAESMPPQCAGDSVVVEGFDVKGVADLERSGATSWTDQPIQLVGTIKDGRLQVADGVQ